MQNPKPFQRRIAIVLLAIFLPSLLPINLMYASNNGPKAPEAASFEPVDATDMVNLITGQYSYVLPLLNIPSPEGGYPLALSYHAGIALDQQASWTGLGWNLNPGAIDRGINGYPDDYKAEYVNEYFYDNGGVEWAKYLSVGYSVGMASVGVGFNWGSNQALGGQVNLGLGFDVGGGSSVGANASIGTSGSSVGLGATFQGGLSIGANISKGGVGFNAGFNSNGAGINISLQNDDLELIINSGNSTGFSISSSTSAGTGIKAGGIGVSYSKFSSNASVNDYGSEITSSNTGLYVPTPIGVFSFSYGKQRIRYQMGKNKGGVINGPIHFNYYANAGTTLQGWQDADHQYPKNYYSMDIYEVPLEGNDLGVETDYEMNNPAFPAYDTYNVQGQGISGKMMPILFENALLYGTADRGFNDKGYKVRNSNNAYGHNVAPLAKFDSKPFFYFNHEISNYLDSSVNNANFNSNNNNLNMFSYYQNGVEENAKPRRKRASYIEYFSNREIMNDNENIKSKGFVDTNSSGFDRSVAVRDGIGAFKITAIDGKTYHYSLPVYNHEIVTRSFGINNKPEQDSHFEKFQLQSYATHWLLTAITGPDFIDNGDGIVGENDLGYWVSFDYGLWSDCFVWKAPFKKDYIIDDENPEIKTWIRGRKQIYYLDKVKTRTHTAIFVKSERNDSKGQDWSFSSTRHAEYIPGFSYTNPYEFKFHIPSQKQLKLDKIILLKNNFDNSNKSFGNDSSSSAYIDYGGIMLTYTSDRDGHTKVPYYSPYNAFDNIIDSSDNLDNTINNSVKIINFNYDYSLVRGDNRLTLKNVEFNGKSESKVLPPYKFDYYSSDINFNIDNQDSWGFLASDPKAYSLRQITTPEGARIKIDYEKNKVKSVVDNKLVFTNKNLTNFTSTLPVYANSNDFSNKKVIIDVGNTDNYPIYLNQIVKIDYLNERIDNNQPASIHKKFFYNGTGYISNVISTNKFEVTFYNDVNFSIVNTYPSYVDSQVIENKINVNVDLGGLIYDAGIRVSAIEVRNVNQNFKTSYKYGSNEDGIGYVSYVPYAQNLTKELPYSSELPAPRAMYEFVNVYSKNSLNSTLDRIMYRFNILKDKSEDQIKFGDFFEIIKTNTQILNYANCQCSSMANGYKNVNVGNYIIKDNLSSLGQLLEITKFNSENHIISKISNNYYGINQIPDNIGIFQESYQQYKEIQYTDYASAEKWLINSSTRITYPSILKSSSNQSNSYTYTTHYNDYDLVSGISKEQVHTTSDGRTFKTKQVPAYTKYPQMGSKVDNINNRNMLSQTATTYSYIQDAGSWKVTGVGITTWSNIWSYQNIVGDVSSPTADKEKIWRQHKSYVWNGVKDANGIFSGYNDTNEDGFVWGVGQPQTNSKWKQTSEITLYDHYSMPLEVKDINNNKSATKMDALNEKVEASGNAAYNEMYYSGAEIFTDWGYWVGQEVRNSSGTRTTAKVHTGKYSIATTSASQFGVLMRNGHRKGKYKISVWVHKDNHLKARLRWFNNDAGNTFPFNGEKVFAGDWVLLNHYTDLSFMDNAVAFWYVNSVDTTTVYFDDLMIRPIASSINGYVYNEYDELTHIIGNNGLATRFEYDAAGRLVKTYVEVADDPANGVIGGFKLAKENKINYKNL
ncbi:hypothetical protein ACI6PS_07895 [Flavobacterium sp. PLA-1-15]|uniref:RHS repeat domain-containing protein n=1 Tax=Flavobacterium sp. PLA-1-15 TaxID=3380533 RepID=UPI003B7FB5D3